MTQTKSLPDLTQSYKNRYPFRLATTSFIYPTTWVPNVRRLGPYVDEIELLILESGAENYPTPTEIRELARLADEMQLTYNIHLPMDIRLGHEAASQRNRAVEVIRRVVDLTADLPVSVHVLHADWQGKQLSDPAVAKWQDRVRSSLECIIASGIAAPSIAVETLENYPISRLETVIFDLNLSVCLDLGHLWLAGLDPLSHYLAYQNQTSILHLHGIDNGKDHRSVAHLNSDQRKTVYRILRDFTGVVSIEVFSLKELTPSLSALETICQDCIRS